MSSVAQTKYFWVPVRSALRHDKSSVHVLCEALIKSNGRSVFLLCVQFLLQRIQFQFMHCNLLILLRNVEPFCPQCKFGKF